MPFADFRFRLIFGFFHSVKKVSKTRIFCEIICVSKKTLVILIRVLCYTAFFKEKKFVFLFLLLFVWFVSGEGISWGGISQWAIFSGTNFCGVTFIRGSFHRGEFHRGQFSGGLFSGGQFFGGQFSWYRYFCDFLFGWYMRMGMTIV